MKLLFDQNLSPKLVGLLADLFPGSTHVLTEGLDSADDRQIWEHARIHQLAIVSKDVDYNNLSVLQVEAAIRARFADLMHFENDSSTGTLIIR